MENKIINDKLHFFKPEKGLKFIKNLGSGGTGNTKLFYDEELEINYAIKKFECASINKPFEDDFYKRFIQEAKILIPICHPYIVRIYNCYLYPSHKTGYLQLEYIDGITIDQFNPESFPNSSWEKVFIQAIEAFTYLESKSIIHRDIRSGNILIDNNGDVKIIDFGFSKVSHNSTFNCSAILNWQGKEPEEVLKNQYSHATDIYYLGLLFKDLLMDSIDTFRFKNILDKMTQFQISSRYINFDEIIKSIHNVYNNKLITDSFNSEQKYVYSKFADNLLSIIVDFLRDYRPITDINEITNNLKKCIEGSQLEQYIQNNKLLLGCFLKNGYTYKPDTLIKVSVVKDFLEMFQNLKIEQKKIVLNNLNTRFTAIEINNIDLPF